MKTIEERAKMNLSYERDFLGRGLSDNMVCRAYVKGATEQKAIDDAERDTAVYNLLQLKLESEKKLWLEKACKWLIENLDNYVGEGGWTCLDSSSYDDCDTYAEIVAKDLRKAMEDNL